ncbi:MAG: tyrosine-type recombinase/integrase, partial [Pirellulales bacterium]|nr:tyrosine-type recombinase/integrase [Pirellulales bacterium]
MELVNKARGNYEPAVKPPTVEKVIVDYRKYLRAERRSTKTLAKYDHAFKRVVDLAQRRSARSIMDINLAFVDAFRAERVAEGAAPKTVHNDTVTIRQLTKFAVRRGLIAKDPLQGLKLAKPKPTPQPCWTRDEVQKIIAAAAEPYRSLLIVLSETGMRVGELKHLTWDDIDLDQGLIHIRPKSGWKPKTGDIRVIPISPRGRAVFEG